MRPMTKHALPIPLLLVLVPTAAQAVNPAEWTIVEELNRTETSKSWVSPTAVDLDKAYWEYEFGITMLTATVNVQLFGDVTVDIIDLVAPEFRMATGETSDLPAVLLDEMLNDEGSGTSADVFVEIDNLGFGRAEFSNIMLGSVDVPIFGNRPIQRLNIEASVVITGFDFAIGDYNHDGGVDAGDYVLWRGTLGDVGPNLPADGNGNEEIDIGDYTEWYNHFGLLGGSGSGLGSIDQTSVPEPSALVTLLTGILAMLLRRRPTVS